MDGGDPTPSIVIWPWETCSMRKRAMMSEVLPLPDGPQTAILWAQGMCNEKPVSLFWGLNQSRTNHISSCQWVGVEGNDSWIYHIPIFPVWPLPSIKKITF